VRQLSRPTLRHRIARLGSRNVPPFVRSPRLACVDRVPLLHERVAMATPGRLALRRRQLAKPTKRKPSWDPPKGSDRPRGVRSGRASQIPQPVAKEHARCALRQQVHAPVVSNA